MMMAITSNSIILNIVNMSQVIQIIVLSIYLMGIHLINLREIPNELLS